MGLTAGSRAEKTPTDRLSDPGNPAGKKYQIVEGRQPAPDLFAGCSTLWMPEGSATDDRDTRAGWQLRYDGSRLSIEPILFHAPMLSCRCNVAQVGGACLCCSPTMKAEPH